MICNKSLHSPAAPEMEHTGVEDEEQAMRAESGELMEEDSDLSAELLSQDAHDLETIEDSRKSRLSGIMSSIRRRNMGK